MSVYERYYRTLSIEYYREVLEILRVLRQIGASTVLDIGCGWGFTGYVLRAHGYSVTGMDIDCRDTLIDCVEHDGNRIPYPFKDGSYDAVISQHYIEHFSKDKQYEIIREMGRIAEKLVLVITPNRRYRWKPPDGHYCPDHKHLLTRDELYDMLTNITHHDLVSVYGINNFTYISRRYHPALSWIVDRISRVLRGYPTLVGIAFYP